MALNARRAWTAIWRRGDLSIGDDGIDFEGTDHTLESHSQPGEEGMGNEQGMADRRHPEAEGDLLHTDALSHPESRRLLRQGGALTIALTVLFLATCVCRLPHLGKASPGPFFLASVNTLIAVDNFWEAGFAACRGIMLSMPPSIESPSFEQRGPYVSYPPGSYYFVYLVSLATGIPPSLSVLAFIAMFWHLILALSTAYTVLLIWPRRLWGGSLMAFLAGCTVLVQRVGMVWMFQFYFAEVPGIALLSILVAVEALRARYPETRHLAVWQAAVLACGAFTHWVFLPACLILFVLRLEETGFRDVWNSVKRLALAVLLPVFLPVAGFIAYIGSMGWLDRLIERGVQRMHARSLFGSQNAKIPVLMDHEFRMLSPIEAAVRQLKSMYGFVTTDVMFLAFFLLMLTFLIYAATGLLKRKSNAAMVRHEGAMARLRPLLLGIGTGASTWFLLKEHSAIHLFCSLYWLAWLGFLLGLLPVAMHIAFAKLRLAERFSGFPRFCKIMWILFILAWFGFGIRYNAHSLRQAVNLYMGTFYKEEMLAKALNRHTEYEDVVFSPDLGWIPDLEVQNTGDPRKDLVRVPHPRMLIQHEYRRLGCDRIHSVSKYLSKKCIYPVSTPADLRRRVEAFDLSPQARVCLLFSQPPAPEWEPLLSGVPATRVWGCLLYRFPATP